MAKKKKLTKAQSRDRAARSLKASIARSKSRETRERSADQREMIKRFGLDDSTPLGTTVKASVEWGGKPTEVELSTYDENITLNMLAAFAAQCDTWCLTHPERVIAHEAKLHVFMGKGYYDIEERIAWEVYCIHLNDDAYPTHCDNPDSPEWATEAVESFIAHEEYEVDRARYVSCFTEINEAEVILEDLFDKEAAIEKLKEVRATVEAMLKGPEEGKVDVLDLARELTNSHIGKK